MGIHLFEDTPEVIDENVKRMQRAISLVVQKAALAGGSYLAEETPVDTGVARSNWVMTIDAPFPGLLPAYVPYPSYRDSHHSMVKTAVVRVPGRRVTARGFRPGSFNAGSP
jgi:hypothetical protein